MREVWNRRKGPAASCAGPFDPSENFSQNMPSTIAPTKAKAM
jgi:hypothetical protein